MGVTIEAETFGELLKIARKKYKWSQQDLMLAILEEGFKVSMPTIGLWERDKNIPRANMILPIAAAIKVPPLGILDLITYDQV